MACVKVAKLGAAVQEVSLPSEGTVADALTASGVDTKECEIRLNGEAVEDTHEVRNGDIITLVPRIRGGGR